MKIYITALFALFIISTEAQEKLYEEQYRPQYHFSPATNWCNDPNGLVYVNGVYHLFYQHNPFGNVWGHMSWGHAVSSDLIHWQHLPLAIPEEDGVMIFSGTCIFDKNNTSRLGKNGKGPMIAIYTGNIENNQSQHLAYSNDNGLNWTKYARNPLLDINEKDFRDPKVFWHQPTNQWVMAVMLSAQHKMQLYHSKNLIHWDLLSEFDPAGDTSSVWECPDLFQVPVEGSATKKKWVLTMSMAPYMQYFVGEFDGKNFKNENPATTIYRPDYGADYYAAISYNQLPATVSPVMIGWINNWDYANDIPTTPWKSAMSLPRTISIKKVDDEWILVQKPVKQTAQLRMPGMDKQNITVTDKTPLNIKSTQFEMLVSFTPNANGNSGVRLATGGGNYAEIGYDGLNKKMYLDRSKCANQNFNKKFEASSFYETKLSPVNNTIKLHIFFDNSIIEVFGNDGEAVMTAQIFPDKSDNGIELFSNGGETIFDKINIWQMKSAWK